MRHGLSHRTSRFCVLPRTPRKSVALGGEMLGWVDLPSNSQPFSYPAAPRAPAAREPAAFGTHVTLEGVGSPVTALLPEVPFFPAPPDNTTQKR